MAIADKLTQLAQIKSDIKAAIIAKGQTVTDDMTQYATAIGNIAGSYAEDTLVGSSATITTTVLNGTYSGDIAIDNTATVTITPNEGYNLPSTVTVVNATYTWDSTTGIILLSDPTGNVTISAECINYDPPVPEEGKLSITQFMSITQNNNVLEVE